MCVATVNRPHRSLARKLILRASHQISHQSVMAEEEIKICKLKDAGRLAVIRLSEQWTAAYDDCRQFFVRIFNKIWVYINTMMLLGKVNGFAINSMILNICEERSTGMCTYDPVFGMMSKLVHLLGHFQTIMHSYFLSFKKPSKGGTPPLMDWIEDGWHFQRTAKPSSFLISIPFSYLRNMHATRHGNHRNGCVQTSIKWRWWLKLLLLQTFSIVTTENAVVPETYIFMAEGDERGAARRWKKEPID